jgi:hypothetical protein
MNQTPHRLVRIGPALLLTLVSCASTTFQSHWRNPEAQPLRLVGAKAVALFVSNNPTIRRIAEDALAREVSSRGVQAVPAYTLLSDEEIDNVETARAKLESAGFDGAVVMRVVGRETQVTYEPGFWTARPYYRRFWGGYWGWGWGRVRQPGYLRQDRLVSVETLVYSFRQDELVWAGISKTVNPSRIEGLVSDLVKAVAKELEKEGLLANAPAAGG